MKYRLVLQEGIKALEARDCGEAKIDAGYLLEYVTGMKKADYLLHMNDEMPEDQAQRYRGLIERRATHEPLQYITGEQDFMGLTFYVTPDVLIPRQDTELLVEKTLEVLKGGEKILDMCTGSGCILTSLLHFHPDCIGTGVDLSSEALEVAQENAKHNQVKATWICSDLFEQVEEAYDVIVSNPPYIATDVIPELMPEVVVHEPYQALDGHQDGLFFYQKICDEVRQYLRPEGYLLFEIGYDQGEAVSDLMKAAGFLDVAVIKDYCENDRVVMGHL